ncbi:tetratricopeptide repeat protein [Actinophytocola sp.]|uniref:tetratricopeptide repeat protein n=1 Tax=Actinophytocola sp. TaxID=1872138 RepID=UPI00389A104D
MRFTSDAGSGAPYDVCLSFAGEQRGYVDRVAAQLVREAVRVFYDRYETAALWGEDLVHHLDRVFRAQARFCVMFVSADYASKIWTTHERRSIQARAIRSATAYILPVRFDETEIPGLLDTVGYLNAGDLTPEQVADLVVAKMRDDATSDTVTYAPKGVTQPEQVQDAHSAQPASRVITSQLFGITPVVGRDGLLADLAGRFSRAASGAAARPVLHVLTGIGGIGKSSLARAYGGRNQDRYNLIWWIRSETAELAVEDFRGLLVTLGVSEVQRLEQPVQLAHVLLGNRVGRWLLVFDNVPRQPALRGLVPPEGAGDVIVTSRTQAWSDPRIVLPVPPLTEDFGAALLRDTSRDDNAPAARALVAELGGLPLALHQAGSYVAENPIGLIEYLRLYQEHRARLNHLGSAPDYDLRVGTTWEVSFQMIPENAQTVLNVLAWLGPEMVPLDLLLRRQPVGDVPTAVADRVNSVFTNELDYLNAVSALSGYGLAIVTDRDATVHRLIQAVTRDSAEPQGATAEWAGAAAALLLAAVPTPPANADRIDTWLRLRPHIAHHLRITPLSESVLSLRLRHWRAQWTGEIGRPHEALVDLTDLLKDQTRVLGETHPDTLRSRHSRAQWTGESGDFPAAVASFDEVTALWTETAGPDHPEALRARHSSAYWLGEAGDPEGACGRLRDVLARRSRTLGADHPDTLRTKHSLAYRTGQTGDYASACAMLEELLPVRTRILGRDHPHTLRTRYSLAQSLGRGGNPARARELTADLLADQTRVLGGDHPHTLRTRYNLAHWTGATGDHEAQRTALTRLLQDQNRILGSDHPDTKLTRQALESLR